jgi:hypothetical protein
MSFALMGRVIDHWSHTATASLVERITMTPLTTAPSVLIRAARGSDGPALEALAGLDSATVPAGGLLVAEADGELVAALGPGGERIADPFRPTADVIALLELRAGRSRAARRRRGLAERLGLRPAPRARAA